MLDAWREDRPLPLKIVGDGPLRSDVEAAAAQLPGIVYLGTRPRAEVLRLMKDSAVLVFPSQWYEGFPMTIVESFACGTPVLASALGSMQEIVLDDQTGKHFEPGNARDLGRAIDSFAAASHDRRSHMRSLARQEFLDRYTADHNYSILMGIYDRALSAMCKAEHRVGGLSREDRPL
jgi:glycosyltransferase involved in cell wall biosynthesis